MRVVRVTTFAEDNGYITGYTPIVNPELFGTPYLVTVQFDDSYRDMSSYLDSIESYLEKRSKFAIITSFMNSKTLQFNCVIITDDIDTFYQGLLNKSALNPNIVDWFSLTNIRGIPDYGRGSLEIDK